MLRDGFAYWYLLTRIISGHINAGEFVLYFTAISQFVDILGSVVFSFENIQKASYQISDIREYLNLENNFNHEESAITPGENIVIELKDVSYRYPGAENDTLHKMNLTVKENENVALVGTNGAGKTTLIKLIMGMYIPTSGEIFINNIPMSQYNIDDYYKVFSAVFQKITILPISIADNITIGKEDAEKLGECIQKADLERKIDSLKKGTQTLMIKEVNEGATEFSGGEKQKLMLARALYKDGGTYILDEPTAALDPLAESKVYEKYNSFTENKSSIFISHRLASTKFCDVIVFLENGQIEEYGTHDELMKFDGKYRKMYELQSQYYN